MSEYLEPYLKSEYERKSMQNALEREKYFEALSNVFHTMYQFNIRTGEGRKLGIAGDINNYLPDIVSIRDAIKLCEMNDLNPEDIKEAEKFFDTRTIADRLSGRNLISQDFNTLTKGWVKFILMAYERDEEGYIVSVILMVRDINREKAEEEENRKTLEKARDEVMRAFSVKNEFMNRMSHDMRTPLNGIMGMSQVIMLELDDNTKSDWEKVNNIRKEMDTVMRSTQNLLALVDDVLDISKLDSGRIVLKKQKIDVEKLRRIIYSIVKEDADKKNITIEYYLQQETHRYILGDEARIKQIMINVLSNAVKFTPEGGRIIFLYEESPGKSPGSIGIKCTTQDFGIGMSSKALKKAGEPFWQADAKSARTDYEGTGLGLAITQRLLDLMGGSMDIKSEKGKGTTVTTYIEAEYVGETNQSRILENGGPIIDLSERKVLVVDDSATNQIVLKSMLTSEGMLAHTANNGYDAIEIFERSRINEYDIIIMDILMPGIDGFETVKRLRELDRPDARKIPILAVSADSEGDYEDRVSDSRIDGFLLKPIKKEVLISMIRSQLEGG